MGFPVGTSGKEPVCQYTGDVGSIPGLGRSPGEGNGYPLQYSGLENSTDRGAWQATVHGVAKSRKRLERLSLHFTSNCKSLQQQKSTLPCDSSGHVNVPHFLVSSLTSNHSSFPSYCLQMRVYHYVYSFWFYVYKPMCRTSSASLSSTSSRKPSLTTIYPTEVSHLLGLTINTITLFLYPCLFIT